MVLHRCRAPPQSNGVDLPASLRAARMPKVCPMMRANSYTQGHDHRQRGSMVSATGRFTWKCKASAISGRSPPLPAQRRHAIKARSAVKKASGVAERGVRANSSTCVIGHCQARGKRTRPGNWAPASPAHVRRLTQSSKGIVRNVTWAQHKSLHRRCLTRQINLLSKTGVFRPRLRARRFREDGFGRDVALEPALCGRSARSAAGLSERGRARRAGSCGWPSENP